MSYPQFPKASLNRIVPCRFIAHGLMLQSFKNILLSFSSPFSLLCWFFFFLPWTPKPSECEQRAPRVNSEQSWQLSCITAHPSTSVEPQLLPSHRCRAPAVSGEGFVKPPTPLTWVRCWHSSMKGRPGCSKRCAQHSSRSGDVFCHPGNHCSITISPASTSMLVPQLLKPGL